MKVPGRRSRHGRRRRPRADATHPNLTPTPQYRGRSDEPHALTRCPHVAGPRPPRRRPSHLRQLAALLGRRRRHLFDDLPWSLHGGDADGDGDIDLVLTHEDADTISYMFNNGSGRFNGAHTIPAGDAPRRAQFADLNGDGLTDIVCTNRLGNSVEVYLHTRILLEYKKIVIAPRK